MIQKLLAAGCNLKLYGNIMKCWSAKLKNGSNIRKNRKTKERHTTNKILIRIWSLFIIIEETPESKEWAQLISKLSSRRSSSLLWRHWTSENHSTFGWRNTTDRWAWLTMENFWEHILQNLLLHQIKNQLKRWQDTISNKSKLSGVALSAESYSWEKRILDDSTLWKLCERIS